MSTLLAELLAVEESFLRQKSRIQWLKGVQGDQNTSFFHKIVKGRELHKRITTVYDSDGHVIQDEQLIKMEINNLY